MGQMESIEEFHNFEECNSNSNNQFCKKLKERLYLSS